MGKVTADHFKKALLAERDALTERHHAMLKAHYQADDHTLTVTELARAARYETNSAANLHYGKLGKLLGPHLPIKPKEKAKGPGDMRPIALLPLFYRVWAATRRGIVRNWETGAGHHECDVLGRAAGSAQEDGGWPATEGLTGGRIEATALTALGLEALYRYARVTGGR